MNTPNLLAHGESVVLLGETILAVAGAAFAGFALWFSRKKNDRAAAFAFSIPAIILIGFVAFMIGIPTRPSEVFVWLLITAILITIVIAARGRRARQSP